MLKIQRGRSLEEKSRTPRRKEVKGKGREEWQRLEHRSISTTTVHTAAGVFGWLEEDGYAALEQKRWNWMQGDGCASRMEKNVFILADTYFP